MLRPVTSGPDLIREVNDAVERKDLAAVAERLHPDVVWKHNVGVGTPEEGEYQGRDSVIALFERILEPWEYLRMKPKAVRDLGAGVVQVEGEMQAKYEDFETPILTPYLQRVEIQGGLLVSGYMVQGSGARLPESEGR
jgi:ketosteroid isomerase-like protein